jgi:hypothetical protein
MRAIVSAPTTNVAPGTTAQGCKPVGDLDEIERGLVDVDDGEFHDDFCVAAISGDFDDAAVTGVRRIERAGKHELGSSRDSVTDALPLAEQEFTPFLRSMLLTACDRFVDGRLCRRFADNAARLRDRMQH